MKKRDIWISIAILAAAVVLLCLCFRGAGRIEIDAGGATAVMQLRSNWFRRTTVASGAEPASAGAGVHRPRRLTISMESNGHTWRMYSLGPWQNLSKIRVENSKTTAVRLGPPLLVKPEVHRKGSHVDVDFVIVGQAGEWYRKFATRNGRGVRRANFRIMDETGNILKAGGFRFG